MTSNQQDPHRPGFEGWALDNLPQGYSLDMDEGDYADSRTRVAFYAFKAGLDRAERIRRIVEETGISADSVRLFMWIAENGDWTAEAANKALGHLARIPDKR
jgi:hypothetical protein